MNPTKARVPRRPSMRTKLKHRRSMAHNFLAGITAEDWWRLLRANRFAVDPAYWHRGMFISAISVMNSYYAWQEERRFGDQVRATTVDKAPLFVLGHWRSGTTHLHNLLGLDQQFAFPNTYQVANPHSFLSTEHTNSRRLAFLVPDKRPMDNMALSFDSAQEDEYALLLDCFRSPYLGFSFPRSEERYERFLTFRDAPAEDVDAWKAALLSLARKLTYKHGKPLLLKSPAHTARIKLILEVFPNARFVHIHRDPYTVFKSTQHLYDTAMWYEYLQRPDRRIVDAGILDRYTRLYDAFFEERCLIPPGRYHEMGFEALEAEPVEQMRLLYERLCLPGFDSVEPRLREYVESLNGYRKNDLRELSPELREAVATQWRRSFEEWGYGM